jgi:uncharacterized protein YegP (UPF0339 family)
MKFYIYRDAQNQWRWYLLAANNVDKIADSAEGYRNKQDCLHGIGLVMDTNRSTPVYER